MAGDHTIYLTSSGSKNLFTNNTPNRFTNKLSSPIVLDSNLEYEIGLISILYPDQYYAITSDSDDFGIHVFTTMVDGKRNRHRVKMKFNMLAGDMRKIIKVINNKLIQNLEIYYYNFFPHIFKDETVIRWNDEEEKTEIVFNKGDTGDGTGGGGEGGGSGDITSVSIRFKKSLASILGFRSDVLYTVFSKNEDVGNIMSSIPPSPKCGVDYIYLYTDIVHPTNFGGQLVNILDCFSLENGGGKGIHNCIYKTLNTNIIDQISLIIVDQKGRAIRFREDSTLTCVLHIRPK